MLGLVPTMGYLHEGHLSLVRRAKAENDAVAVTIFVNPTQFGPTEDLAAYPRDLERDLALLREAGVDLVWTPTVGEVYPARFSTYIDVEGVSEPLEGARRPGHFRGVATVVAILLAVSTPTRAYFGQKDAQPVSYTHLDVYKRQLQAFPTPDTTPGAGVTWTHTTEDAELAAILERLTLALGGRPHALGAAYRPAYHAAAVLAANYPATLVAHAAGAVSYTHLDVYKRQASILAVSRSWAASRTCSRVATSVRSRSASNWAV